MTVKDGFILKQGEGREGKDPLQGLQGLLESWKKPQGWGDAEGTVGSLGAPPVSAGGRVLLQNFCLCCLQEKSEIRTVLALPAEAAAKNFSILYVCEGIFYPGTR